MIAKVKIFFYKDKIKQEKISVIFFFMKVLFEGMKSLFFLMNVFLSEFGKTKYTDFCVLMLFLRIAGKGSKAVCPNAFCFEDF